MKRDYKISSGNVFKDLRFKHPKRELRRAKRVLALWRQVKAMTEDRMPITLDCLASQIAHIHDDMLELTREMRAVHDTALRCCAAFDEWRARWSAEPGIGPEDIKVEPVPRPKLIGRLYEVVDELSDVIANLEDADAKGERGETPELAP
jgi:hypothetical protein